jgi:type II secretory pathway pseudopilin PulG
LAILAAIAIPALTGYIDKANEKQYIAKLRTTKMAMQTLLDENYADGWDLSVESPDKMLRESPTPRASSPYRSIEVNWKSGDNVELKAAWKALTDSDDWINGGVGQSAGIVQVIIDENTFQIVAAAMMILDKNGIPEGLAVWNINVSPTSVQSSHLIVPDVNYGYEYLTADEFAQRTSS